MSVTFEERSQMIKDFAIQDAKDIANEIGKIRIPELIVGFLMVFFDHQIAGLPLPTIIVALLIFIAMNRKAYYTANQIIIFCVTLCLTVLLVAVNSVILNGISTGDTARRSIHILISIGLAFYVADKRIDFRSLIMGISTGLLLNIPFFYAGLNSNTYGGYLTGWLLDKNVAGIYYSIIGLFATITVRKKPHKIIIILAFLFFTFLTGSRTSTAALIFALLWLVIAPRLNLISKLGLGVFIVWAVDWLTENFSNNEAFGDRTGTDALRRRIDEASYDKAQSAPWHGMGYGSATVDVQNHEFFFHNSFWSLIVEGGYLYMVVIVSLTIIAAFIWAQSQGGVDSIKTLRNVTGEAAIVLLFICSWRLGEVLLTTPWALAVGLSLSYLVVPKNRCVGSMHN